MSDKPKKKKFSETGFGKFVMENVKPLAGNVLEVVGDLTGRDSIEKLGQFLSNKASEDTEAAGQYEALRYQLEEKRMEFQLEYYELQLEEQRIELDAFKAEVADRNSARSREVEYMKASGGKRDPLMAVVVIVSLLMYIGSFVFLAFGPPIITEKRDLFNMAVGQVMTFAGMAFSYYLGTTRSSRQKDDAIKQVLNK